MNTPTPLPKLDEAGALRDQVARHEAASVERATQLNTKATGCQDCQALTSSVAHNAQGRLETMGGMWQPWPADTPQSLVELPAPVAEAPLSPQAFTQWLHVTARHDIMTALELHRNSPSKVTTEQVVPILAVGSSRALDAWALASAYDVDLDKGAPALAVLVERSVELAGNEEGERASWTLKAADLSSPLSDPHVRARVEDALPQALADSAQAGQAIRTWDCVAQTLPHVDLSLAPLNGARTYADALLTRSTDFLGKGAPDERQLRCELDVSSTSELAQQVLAADMALALASSEEVSIVGVELLLTDLHQWKDVLTSTEVAALLGA